MVRSVDEFGDWVIPMRRTRPQEDDSFGGRRSPLCKCTEVRAVTSPELDLLKDLVLFGLREGKIRPSAKVLRRSALTLEQA